MPSIDETNRQRFTFFITTGPPTASQEPCDTFKDYFEAGIEIMVAGIGFDFVHAVPCIQNFTSSFTTSNTLSQSAGLFGEAFEINSCAQFTE